MAWANIPRNPSARTLRQFAILWVVFFGGLALASFLRTGDTLSARILAIVALTVGPAGILMPALMRPIFVGWMIAVFPIGWLVLHACLALIYFCLITPLAYAFRLMNRDLLDLRRQPKRTSYWVTKEMPTSPSQYYRTF